MDSKTLYHSFSPFNFIKQKGWLKCFRDLFEIKDTEFFFLHISLAKHRNFRNWHQILQPSQFMYSLSTGNLLPEFDSFFFVNNIIHSYHARHASFFRLPCLQDKHKAVFNLLSRP